MSWEHACPLEHDRWGFHPPTGVVVEQAPDWLLILFSDRPPVLSRGEKAGRREGLTSGLVSGPLRRHVA